MPIPSRQFIACFLLVVAGSLPAYGQFSRRVFEFANLPATARTAGLGGVNAIQGYGEPGAAFDNPALLAPEAAGYLTANYMGLVAGIHQGTAGYAWQRPDSALWHIGVRYLDYGEFEGFDPSGQPTGPFQSSDYALSATYSHQVGLFRAGLGLSMLRSSIAGEGATALAADLGMVFLHPEKDLTAGLVFKNIGFVIDQYPGTTSKMPWDVQAGISFKPQFMPFRFSLTAYNLLHEQVVYEVADENLPFTESLFRRLVFGTQVALGRSVVLRAGYNHLLRKELRLEQAGGGAGFSYGLEVRTGYFTIGYSHLGYHAAGGGDHLSFAVDMERLTGKLF